MEKYTFIYQRKNIFGTLIANTEKTVTSEEYKELFSEITDFLKATGIPIYAIVDFYEEQIDILNDEMEDCANFIDARNEMKEQVDVCNE
jgi:hypothetical protein